MFLTQALLYCCKVKGTESTSLTQDSHSHEATKKSVSIVI